jgi:hypothetical protein
MPGRPITVAHAEHISLESTPDIVASPLRHPHRKTVARFHLQSSLRGSEIEVNLLEDHYVSVRMLQPGEDVKKYTLDLRFANPRPVIARHVAWAMLALALSSFVGTLACLWWAAAGKHGWLHPGVFMGAAGAITTALSVWQFMRRTTESLQFKSVHGGATLISITGGIGSAKAGRRFFVDLIKNINAAKAARAQSKPHFLRDEMREHHRLRELRVLSELDYEASKTRILAAHA